MLASVIDLDERLSAFLAGLGHLVPLPILVVTLLPWRRCRSALLFLYVCLRGKSGCVGFWRSHNKWPEVNTLHYRGAWRESRREPPKRQVQGHLLQASRPTKPNPTRAHQD